MANPNLCQSTSQRINHSSWLDISIATQSLSLYKDNQKVFTAPVSTAANGPGQTSNSGCTPCGWLQIKAMIGKDCPLNSVFVGRRFSGEIYTPELGEQYPQRDWILTRIIWLGGLEPGINRYGELDTLRRFIYIHGCPDSYPMGVAKSHGCVRMHNQQLAELFSQLTNRMPVYIHAD